jgi:hypothetical protein
MAALPRPVELPVLLRVEFAQLNNNTRNQNRGADDDMDGDAENEELAVSPLPPLPSTLSLATCVAFDANNFCVAFDANNLCVAFDANNFHIRSLHAPREGASRVKVRVRFRVTHQGKVQADPLQYSVNQCGVLQPLRCFRRHLPTSAFANTRFAIALSQRLHLQRLGHVMRMMAMQVRGQSVRSLMPTKQRMRVPILTTTMGMGGTRVMKSTSII